MIGFTNPGSGGEGDKIFMSFFPENYYKNTGRKLIDIDKSWVYLHNPYIVQEGEPKKIINIWDIRQSYKNTCYYSPADRICELFGWKVYLRHPRLYKYEELKIIPDFLVLHIQGVSCGGAIPDNIIDYIKERYSNYQIIQVGAKTDKDAGVLDMRNLSFLGTAEIIAQSSLFIGVNSSNYCLSLCYPKVNKKVLILEKDPVKLEKMFPLLSNDGSSHFLDFGVQYYNIFEKDIGITFSYKKI